MTSAANTPLERDVSVTGETSLNVDDEVSADPQVDSVAQRSERVLRISSRKSKKLGGSVNTNSSGKYEMPDETEQADLVNPGSHAQTTTDASDEQRENTGAPEPRETPVLSVERARERGRVAAQNPVVLQVNSLSKQYGGFLAASDIKFQVHAGSFTGVVGPNGAGKTTVLSMVSGLNRPTNGSVTVNGIDVWADGPAAKRVIGSLPDRLRLFDRLTGSQLMYYFGVLHGLSEETVASRATELAVAFGLESALDRVVSDYSSGMQKKIGLACAMIHAPEILVLDEPFETIDPVSAATVTEILEKFVAGGGSVVMSSHSLELIQRVCDHVVVIANGHIVANGTVDSVRAGLTLEERFATLTQSTVTEKGLEWLRASGNFA